MYILPQFLKKIQGAWQAVPNGACQWSIKYQRVREKWQFVSQSLSYKWHKSNWRNLNEVRELDGNVSMLMFWFEGCIVAMGENVPVCREYTPKCSGMIFIMLASSFQMVGIKCFVQYMQIFCNFECFNKLRKYVRIKIQHPPQDTKEVSLGLASASCLRTVSRLKLRKGPDRGPVASVKGMRGVPGGWMHGESWRRKAAQRELWRRAEGPIQCVGARAGGTHPRLRRDR